MISSTTLAPIRPQITPADDPDVSANISARCIIDMPGNYQPASVMLLPITIQDGTIRKV